MAVSAEAADRLAAEALIERLRTQVRRTIGSGTINPWCGLCHAPAERWRYEVGRTRFASMAEAEPVLRQSEREQSAVRRLFGEG